MSTNHSGGRSWHLSVLFRTNQLFPELLFKAFILTSFKTTSNQTPSTLFKILNPSCVQIKHPLKLFSCKLARYIYVQNLQNLQGEAEMFSKGSRVSRSNPNVKILPTCVVNNFNLCGMTKYHSVWPLSFLPRFLKFTYHLGFFFSKFLFGFKFLQFFF